MNVMVLIGEDVRKIELEYVLDQIISARYDLKFYIEIGTSIPKSQIHINLPNKSEIVINSTLLAFEDNLWLETKSLNDLSCKDTLDNPIDGSKGFENLPLITFNSVNKSWSFEEDRIILGFDIFSAIFFMITRYEEYNCHDKDIHSRFRSEHSKLDTDIFKRPIVDDYTDYFITLLNYLNIYPTKKSKKYRITMTHDIDHISYWRTIKATQLSLHVLSKIFKKIELKSAYHDIHKWIKSKSAILNSDLFFTSIFKLMELNEKDNIRSSFYFIPRQHGGKYDSSYNFREKTVINLLKTINDRGHEIGIHPSYKSFESGLVFHEDIEYFRETLQNNDINQTKIGGRNHYLRWNVRKSWWLWDQEGLDYDSTVYFPELPGFRCGTCHPFHPFNLEKRKAVNLIEKPLLLMDRSLFNQDYISFDKRHENTIDVIDNIKSHCKRVDGEFVVLWHNTSLIHDEQISLYKHIIST